MKEIILEWLDKEISRCMVELEDCREIGDKEEKEIRYVSKDFNSFLFINRLEIFHCARKIIEKLDEKEEIAHCIMSRKMALDDLYSELSALLRAEEFEKELEDIK